MRRLIILLLFLGLAGCATVPRTRITQSVNVQQYFTDERKNWIGEFVIFHFHTSMAPREESSIITGLFMDSEQNIRWEITPTKPFYFVDNLLNSNLLLNISYDDPYGITSKVYKIYIKDNEINQYITFPRKQHPDWSNEIWDLLKNRKIRFGMTKEQVELAWGKPGDINRTVGSWGTHEQWIYGSQYLYFENGTLTSWQD